MGHGGPRSSCAALTPWSVPLTPFMNLSSRLGGLYPEATPEHPGVAGAERGVGPPIVLLGVPRVGPPVAGSLGSLQAPGCS